MKEDMRERGAEGGEENKREQKREKYIHFKAVIVTDNRLLNGKK